VAGGGGGGCVLAFQQELPPDGKLYGRQGQGECFSNLTTSIRYGTCKLLTKMSTFYYLWRLGTAVMHSTES
jgi:hypothetical protein